MINPWSAQDFSGFSTQHYASCDNSTWNVDLCFLLIAALEGLFCDFEHVLYFQSDCFKRHSIAWHT